jgi:transcriptional regulator with XRE-family HTH domain
MYAEMTMITLAEFITQEMRRRNMSARQFADFVGVTNQTISRAVDPSKVPQHGLDFLNKLAKATNTDLCTIVSLLYPEETKISARARVLAERIDRLPQVEQDIIDRYLLGLSLQSSDQAT